MVASETLNKELREHTIGFRQELGRIFTEPHIAEERFRDYVQEYGIDATQKTFAEFPAQFGNLKATLTPAADLDRWASVQNAASLGAKAHQLNIAMRNPHLAAGLLEERLQQTAIEFRNKGLVPNADRFLRNWDRAVMMRGIEHAKDYLQRNPAQFGLKVDTPQRAEATQEISRLAIEATATKNAPRPEQPAPKGVDALPGAQAPDFQTLSPQRQITKVQQDSIDAQGVLKRLDQEDQRLANARSAMRESFRKVYADPAMAEKNFRMAAKAPNERRALEQVAASPQAFGKLRGTPAGGLGRLVNLKTTAPALAHAKEASTIASRVLKLESELRKEIHFHGLRSRIETRKYCEQIISQAPSTIQQLRSAIKAMRPTQGPALAPTLTQTVSL